MKNTTISKFTVHVGTAGISALVVAAMLTVAGSLYGYSPKMRREMMTGPWEVMVHVGMEGKGLSFPVKVADEDKPEKLDITLPVMGTPVEIILEQYMPDLQWETSVVKKPAGGVVAELSVKGPNLDQKFWLDSSDQARQSMSSPIGGIRLRRIHDPNKVEKLLGELGTPKVPGLLTIWPPDSNSPVEYLARPGETIKVPKSDYKVTVVEYIRHYQIDMKTRKVVSASKKPVNPALKIEVNDGKKTREEWLWARFPSSPHQKVKLPFRLEFTDFDLGGDQSKYILAAARPSKSWLLSFRDGKTKVEAVVRGKAYLFTNEAYSFSVGNVTANATTREDWKSGSQSLLGPALIATMKNNKTAKRVVLELNKPAHVEAEPATVVLLFRPVRQGMGASGASEKGN